MDSTKILIVEDSPTQAFQLKFLLEEHDFQVLDANDGYKALELLQKNNDISLIISDIQMPGMNGFELCKTIKSSRETSHIPVVLLTSLSGQEDVFNGIESGADSFINKPYDPGYLVNHLNHLLEHYGKLKSEHDIVRFEAFINNERVSVTADPRRMFSLLSSIYEAARLKNGELIKSQEALETLNSKLEDKVRQRTQEVVQSEKKYRSLVENALVGVFNTRVDGQIDFVNEAFARMLEFDSVEEILNSGSVTQYYQDINQRERLLAILKKERQVDQFEFVMKTKKGNNVFVALSAKLNGDLLSGILMDITKLKQAELKIREINASLERRVRERTKELQNEVEERKKIEIDMQKAKEIAEEATRAKSLFLANMSHEIRTPMNALLGFTEILSRRITDPVQMNYLESMKKSGNALLALINDLLDLSKAEAHKLELSPENIDIRYLVADIKEILLSSAEQKNIDLICEVAEDVPDDFYVDELRLRQVLMNLAGNAIKFTEKGHVKISVFTSHITEKKADLIMEVEDTGKGIPKKYHNKIFNLFEQQSGDISRTYGGTGMGLSISRQIAELMNGRIELESESGKGSTFKVVLPGLPRTGKKNKAEKIRSKGNSGTLQFEPARILIVDDANDNLQVLGELLKSYSFEVLEAKNGKLALQQMEKNKIDLVLTDVRMPVMDGLTLVKKIRENKKWSKISVVALSASDSKYETKNYKVNGFDAFLRKPVSVLEIEKVLKKFLKYNILEKKKLLEESDISPSTLKNAGNIFREIENNILPLHEGLLKIRPRKKVAEMASALKQIGDKFASHEVREYGVSLETANRNFQVAIERDLIERFLDWYKNLVEKCNHK